MAGHLAIATGDCGCELRSPDAPARSPRGVYTRCASLTNFAFALLNLICRSAIPIVNNRQSADSGPCRADRLSYNHSFVKKRVKPLIVVTNDDGIQALGLRALARALERLGEVFVVAPAQENSAVSHSLTIHHPIRILRQRARRFALAGTPVDCVLFAIQKICPRKPDLLVSGINAGANLGDDILYSGTVAAAREGSMYDIPSIAVSQAQIGMSRSCAAAADFTRLLAAKVLRSGLPVGVFLNLNFPMKAPIGVKITRQGSKQVQSFIAEKDDPRGRKYYWIGEDQSEWNAEPDTDYFAIKNGYISISPLQRDQTAYQALKTFRKFEKWNVI